MNCGGGDVRGVVGRIILSEVNWIIRFKKLKLLIKIVSMFKVGSR